MFASVLFSVVSIATAELVPDAKPAHTWTHIKGALGKDNDAVPPQNLTLAAAEAKCSALPNCPF